MTTVGAPGCKRTVSANPNKRSANIHHLQLDVVSLGSGLASLPPRDDEKLMMNYIGVASKIEGKNDLAGLQLPFCQERARRDPLQRMTFKRVSGGCACHSRTNMHTHAYRSMSMP